MCIQFSKAAMFLRMEFTLTAKYGIEKFDQFRISRLNCKNNIWLTRVADSAS